jgi:hypothetical protein
MATTSGGSTYVVSTDLVANYPTASLALANRVDVVAGGSMLKKTANYTVTVADILSGATICMNSATATVITLPSTGLVNGMVVDVYSINTGGVTFTGGTVTGSVNSITTQYSGVSLQYDSAAAVWWCLPFSPGVAAANFTNTATGTYTGYKYVTFTGNGSLVIDRAGEADVWIVAGGAGGGGGRNGWNTGGGGGGGGIFGQTVVLAAGTYTVTVGAGGALGAGSSSGAPGLGSDGSYSQINAFYAVGGGGGGAADALAPGPGRFGGCGGGAAYSGAGGAAVTGQGFSGSSAGGGGGGGAAATTGTGGVGRATSITNTSVTYSVGGTTAGTTAGGANTGRGGDGGGSGGANGSAGGSGIVIIRVAV